MGLRAEAEIARQAPLRRSHRPHDQLFSNVRTRISTSPPPHPLSRTPTSGTPSLLHCPPVFSPIFSEVVRQCLRSSVRAR